MSKITSQITVIYDIDKIEDMYVLSNNSHVWTGKLPRSFLAPFNVKLRCANSINFSASGDRASEGFSLNIYQALGPNRKCNWEPGY